MAGDPGSRDAELRRACIAGMAPCWAHMAVESGGSVWERDGVVASVVPKAPARSVFNSVFFEDGEALLASLDDIRANYEANGVSAWTVWVPDDEDPAVAVGLARAGHVLDANPCYMGMELGEVSDPGPPEGFEFRQENDYAEMARLNEIAYGYPPGDFVAVAEAPMDGARLWFADRGGEAVCTIGIWPYEGDAVVLWVATLPEARGKGLSGRLLARALEVARDDGLRTTTLQATKLGYPVYEKLGYRDLGAAEMWERRRPGS